MKTKELSKRVRDKVVGWVIKIQKIIKRQTEHRSIHFKKLKEYGTTTILPREGGPPKHMDQSRRAFIREATKRPKITLNELQSSTAEIGVSVHRTTLSHTLHSAGLYGIVAKKKPLLKKK